MLLIKYRVKQKYSYNFEALQAWKLYIPAYIQASVIACVNRKIPS